MRCHLSTVLCQYRVVYSRPSSHRAEFQPQVLSR